MAKILGITCPLASVAVSFLEMLPSHENAELDLMLHPTRKWRESGLPGRARAQAGWPRYLDYAARALVVEGSSSVKVEPLPN